MASSSVGLVLRPQSVEVIELKKTLKGFTVSKKARVAISGTQDFQVTSAIKAALSSAQVKTTRLGVTVPAQDVLIRSFTLPSLPKPEWRTAIGFEARKFIPFKTDELIWDFHAVEQRGTKELAVVFTGIRSQTFIRIQDWLKDVGIRPLCIEPPWFSLARAVAHLQKTSPEEFVGVVDVEPDAAHLAIVRGGLPYLARDVSLVASAPPLEGVGMSPSAPDPKLEKLLGELRLSFDFFSREHPSASVSKLLLFGDPATLTTWRSWLAEQVSCPVVMGAELPELMSESLDPGFALAIGLALREVKSGGPRIDFLARSTSQAASKGLSLDRLRKLEPDLIRSLAKPLAVQVALAVVALAALASLGNRQAAQARQEFEQSIRSFADVGWDLKEKPKAELETLQSQVDQRLAFLRQMVQQRVSVAEKLDALAKALPDGVWLEGVSYKDRLDLNGARDTSLSLEGACFLPESGAELDLISQFAQQIKQDEKFFKGFASAQLGEIAQSEDDTKQYSFRTFRLNCQLDRRL